LVLWGRLSACGGLLTRLGGVRMKLLIIAADKIEFSGILAKARSTRPVPLAVRWARTALLSGHEVLLAANGMGAAAAAAAVDRALEAFPADAVVSTGICGALRPELSPGDLVVADFVCAGERRFAAQPFSGSAPFRTGTVYSAGHVVRFAAEKAQLASAGASVVEMEAAGVAERTFAHDLPFYCVKAISDLADENLANDFDKALRKDGQFDTIVLLRGTLRQPLIRIGELLRLRQRCVRAAGSLGDFFADLRF
jgi:adenosylhomocysteine nucleosidase